MPRCALNYCRRRKAKGRTTCWRCLPRHGRWLVELSNRRVRSGCCARCGRERDTVYKRFCKACVKETWPERRRREWVERGRCAGCGSEREDESSKFCVWCNEEREFGR